MLISLYGSDEVSARKFSKQNGIVIEYGKKKG